MFGILNAIKQIRAASKRTTFQTNDRRRKKRGQKSQPASGKEIAYKHLKMQVVRTDSQDLWKWLASQGWHVPDFPGDRRSYVHLPGDTYARLDKAPCSEWPMMIRSLLRLHPEP